MVKNFSENSQFYIIFNSKLTAGALARTNWLYRPNPKYVQMGGQTFHYTRPGGIDKVYKINSKASWVFKIEFSELFLKHANWTDIKSTIVHELSHDYDFYINNGRSHGHGADFLYIFNNFRKLTGVRNKKVMGFATETNNKKWLQEMEDIRYQREVRKRQKEQLEDYIAYVLTKIYDSWYPKAERENNINFEAYWQYLLTYFKTHGEVIQEIANKVNRKIRITKVMAKYWYANGRTVKTLEIPNSVVRGVKITKIEPLR